MQQRPYPVQYSVEYPDRRLHRGTTFFRIFVAIPIVILLGTVDGATASYPTATGQVTTIALGTGGALVLGPALMILFRAKYPRWWFDWNLELQRFGSRVGVFLCLMDDNYPSADEHQAVHLDYVYPDAARDLKRWMPLVKWFLAIPHYVILFFLVIGALIAVVIAWFAILFTGRYPRGLFTYVEGVQRWGSRVFAYAALMVTDEYPPFRLEA
jgi:Domain of unknown function (DUF4389)